MHIKQCLVTLATLMYGLVAVPVAIDDDTSSWDVAATIGEQIEFYKDKVSVNKVGTDFKDLTELTYDPVTNMLFFVGTRMGDDASIFGYDIAKDEFKTLGKTSTPNQNIKSLVYDPVKGILFWIDKSDNSICWTSVEKDIITNETKNILLQQSDQIPQSLAIDSCRGYIYWTNRGPPSTIERARYDGTDREVLIKTNAIPFSVALDQLTKSIYWFEPGYNLLSADLEGNNQTTLLTRWSHVPNKLTITKDTIYIEDDTCHIIWKLPKNDPGATLEEFNTGRDIFSIAANYQIKDQTEGHSDCKALTQLVEEDPQCNFCVNGVQGNDTSSCEFQLGYTGERCDVSVCYNYCFSGNCSVSAFGKPTCSCYNGYIGERCEGVSVCQNYCINNGTCILNEYNNPTCVCLEEYKGARCEQKVTTAVEQHTNCCEMPQTCQCSGNCHPESPCCEREKKSFKYFFLEFNQ